VLTLLAFACVPGLAQAEVCDAGTIQYGECGSIPHSGVRKHQHPKLEGGGKSHPTPSKPETEGEEADSPATGPEDQAEGKHGGAEADKHEGGGRVTIGLAGARSLGAAPPPTPVAAVPGSGGSSPLVPILIAIALLAAASFGAVLYRQRR
jgi:hypothetical protein